ncbi:hypothetical protein M501DRAFT_1002123 [Patellaria atrata CBS 101060]|uniref:Alpha/beta hydrolase fold-3 domain-containing protein n=1 Tax=Patellaria atrata CBS 101060 TaxID=1346257 RepID=A0A9P4SE67_9PEZI|nr:hypothetical protein M501DRAFT_1002123 [Patellaria atrata CBS 101060]
MGEDIFHPDWLQFEKEIGYRPLLYPPFVRIQEQFQKFGGILVSKYEFPAPDPSVKTADHTTKSGIKVRVYTPENYSRNKPVGVYFHGGGWAMGSVDEYEAECRTMAKLADVVLVSVDYRLAPASKWPGPINDCYEGYLWAVEHSKEIGGNGKLFTTGVSAGGHLALSIALKVIDDGKGDSLKGVAAFMPVTCHPSAYPAELREKFEAREKFADLTIDTKDAMDEFWNLFGAPPDHKYASNLLHTKIGSLPKVYLNAAGVDTLRDDARVFKEILDQKGVPNKYDEFEKVPHFFYAFPAPCLKKLSEDYFSRITKGIEYVIS